MPVRYGTYSHSFGKFDTQKSQNLPQNRQSPGANAQPPAAQGQVRFRQDVMGAVKAAEFLGQLEGVIAQNIGRALGLRSDHDIGLEKKLQHQCPLFRGMDGGDADGVTLAFRLAQDALYTDGCILQIGPVLPSNFEKRSRSKT